VAWVQAAETGRMVSSSVAGYTIPGVVLDVDATIVVCHSDKASAAKTWKRTFGYHPLLCFLCRRRHKKHYAEHRIMPRSVLNPLGGRASMAKSAA
jgi:hypothetical protein